MMIILNFFNKKIGRKLSDPLMLKTLKTFLLLNKIVFVISNKKTKTSDLLLIKHIKITYKIMYKI